MRSTRRFRRAPITRSQLARILAAAYAPETVGLGEQGALERDRLMTFIATVAVEGAGEWRLLPGAARARAAQGARRREPPVAAVPLPVPGARRRRRRGGVPHRRPLRGGLRLRRPRAYRHLHLDAGLIGERLDLAALGVGLGASGIGGFFDDHVTGLLGIPSEQAVVYITTIGVPHDQGE